MTQAIVGYPGSNAPVLTNIVVPSPLGHQAMVQVIASGICHSQLNQLDQLAHAADGAPSRLLGHEALGIVAETGPHVSAVIGTGGVGGAAIVAARALGAGEIFAVDLNEEKRARTSAQRHAVHQHGANGPRPDHQPMGRRQGVSGVDHVIDCVAAPSTFSDALAIVRKGRAGFGPGDTVIVVGVAHRPAELDLRFIQLHGIAIKGCFGGHTQGDRDVATYVDWFDDAAVGFRALVNHSYALRDAVRAVDELRDGRITERAIFAIAPNCAAIQE